MPLPSMARHYAFAPSFWRSQGEGWEGAFQALLEAPCSAEPCSAEAVPVNALAEHGSALQVKPMHDCSVAQDFASGGHPNAGGLGQAAGGTVQKTIQQGKQGRVQLLAGACWWLTGEVGTG